MAYMSQDVKKILSYGIKRVLKQYGMKGTISVDHRSTLVVTIREGRLDVIGNYKRVSNPQHEVGGHLDVNEYRIATSYDGEVREFLTALLAAMNGADGIRNHDNSDITTDYFDVGWYTDIHIGLWDKPYKLTA